MLTHRIDEETELRLIEPQHAGALNALVEQNFEHIREWSGWLRRERSIETTREFIKRNLARMADNDGYALAIWHRGEMAGQIEYNYIDWVNRATELGYWLGAEFQGRGLVTKSCRALIEHAFGELGLNRVAMRCAVENRRSRRVPERLGFRQEGVLSQAEWMHDHFHDLVVYAVLAAEWRAAAGGAGGVSARRD
ncbi:MAG TPA: GNAT family N-acetyltransferase [Pyrinomonadaceae bacterium]|jgi:ribosomal-protein-serine acetyltransferase